MRVTLLDLIVLVILVLAAIGGFRLLGGTGRAGRLLGLLVGFWFGLTIGVRLGQGVAAGWGVLAICALGGMLLGVLVGGWLGGLIGRFLVRVRLGFVDRLIGAVAAVAGALLLLWVLALLFPGVAESLGGRSDVLASVDRTLPNSAAAVRALLAGP